MPIRVMTRKMLWGRAGNRCAFPGCAQRLIEDVPGTTGGSVVGEEAHIVARELGGPRGRSVRPADTDAYLNLILLCPVHHKIVDDHPDEYSADALREMKALHEARVASEETPEERALRADEERYALHIDEWAGRVDLDNWSDWISGLTFAGQHGLSAVRFEQLQELRPWLLARLWPHRYPELEDSFHNFRFVLDDLLNVFRSHAKQFDDVLETETFYKIDEWNPERYHQLARKYEEHVDLVQDLALELTRGGNYVCDRVRETIDPAFRVREGALLHMSGPNDSLGWDTLRPEYRDAERIARPYPGLEQFKTDRMGRDFCFARSAPSGGD